MSSTSLVFQNTQFDVVDQDGQPWLKAADIARALGYKKADAVTQIYDRNSDEFTPAMCQTLNLSVSQNNGLLSREVRIFSLRGAHLLAMFARTAVAKAFRKWVLDILDAVTTPAKTTVDSRTPLRDAVNMLVAKKKLMYPDAYAIVHQRFAVGHIDEMTQSQIPQAVEYVHRLVLEGEWMPAQKELPLKQEGYLLTEQEAAALSGVFSWAKRSAALLKDMEAPLRLLKSSLAPDAFDGGNEIWPHLRNTDKVREYAQQASLALQRRVLG